MHSNRDHPLGYCSPIVCVCVWNKQTSIIFYSHSPFCPLLNSLPPFMPSSFFPGTRSSHQLWWGFHRGLSWIAGELKEAGWLHQPSITFHLPHFSLLTSPTEYRLSGLHLAAPRWRVFCSPCTPVISPAPRPDSSLKDYIPKRDLNYTTCPHAPSTRLIILVLWDENLELLFSSYHSHHLKSAVSG